MNIIHKILTSSYFRDAPPVLIDIGASGEINAKWKKIAPYSVCIAYDADDREFRIDEKTNAGYRKLITFNRIVTADPVPSKNFYLTSSPFCSSVLEPDQEKLRPWVFHKLFDVQRKIDIQAITLSQSMEQAGISYIDWFKSDTQGTDLRLFTSLPTKLSDKILAAEFEPGIMDAYKGEDKLHLVMREMDQSGFWLSDMVVKGTQRLKPEYLDRIGEVFTKRIIRRSPCWAEVSYLKQPGSLQSERQYLLLYVFALLEYQYGFALEIMDEAKSRFSEPLFAECHTAVEINIRSQKWKTPLVIMKRQINKLFSGIHD